MGRTVPSHPFASDRRHLRRYLNVVLGYVPPTCRVIRWAAAKIQRLHMGGSPDAPVPVDGRFDASRFLRATHVILEHVRLDALHRLATLPSLQHLRLSEVDVAQTGILAHATVAHVDLHNVAGPIDALATPALTELSLWGTAFPLDQLEGAPRLTTLRVARHPLADFDDLPVLEALDLVDVHDCPTLVSCAGLDRQPELQAVEITDASALASLEGLPGSLASLGLHGVPSLRSLDGLPELPADELSIDGAGSLVDVTRLPKAMPHIERLRISGARRKIDLGPLAGLSSLRLLDLRDSSGVRSVEPFFEHGALRVLLLGGTQATRSSVPPRARWRCSWARNPNIDEMLHRTPPSPGTWGALKGSGRVMLAKIRKLLRAADVDAIDQGLELLSVVDEPAVYDALLEGTDYREVRTASRLARRPWRLGSRRFVGQTRAYVLHRLLADAPEASTYAAAIREGIHTLDFVEPRYPPRPHPLDLRSLAALPNLEALAFARFGPLTIDDEDDEGLTIPKLRRLEVHHQQAPVPTRWLAAQTGLEHVMLIGEHAGSRDLSWVPGLPHLRTLEMNQQSRLDLGALRQATSLEEVSIWSCSGLSTLDGLPEGIKSVKVSWCWQLADIGPLLELESLQEFRRYGCAIPDEQIAQLAARGVRIRHLAGVGSAAWSGCSWPWERSWSSFFW